MTIEKPRAKTSYDSKIITKPLPVLLTERLLLRPLGLDDAPNIYEYAKNPNVSKYTLWEPHKNLADSETFIKGYAFKNYEKGGAEPFGVCFKSEPDVVIGTVGCFWYAKAHKSMELGYALHEKYWGQGITVEACRELLKFVFKNYDVERIQSRYKSQNEASGRVMEKLGMTYEGLFRKAIYHREIFWDMMVYSILKEEWPLKQNQK